MGIREQYKRQQTSEQNKGKPLGGGLDEKPAPAFGKAQVSNVRVEKPVEQGGKRGMRVSFRVSAQMLGGTKLVLETTLHDQELGQLKTAMATFADATGLLNVWEIYTPPTDAEAQVERAVFIPFEAMQVAREGALWCNARVRVLESARGCLAQAEEAFKIEAG